MSDTAVKPDAKANDPKTDNKPVPAATPPADPNAAPPADDGEAGKRGRKPGSTVVRPDTSGIDLAAIADAVVAPAEVRDLAAPKLERKPEQLAMDKVAERAHEAWVKAGRPAAWPKMPVITYYLNPTHVEAYKYLIRRACDFHGTRPRFGSPARVSESLAAKIGHPDYTGREILAWAVLDKRPKTSPKVDGDKSKTDAPTPPAAPASTK